MWFCCQIWQCNFKTCFAPFEIWKVWNGWSHVVYPTKGNSAPDSFTNPSSGVEYWKSQAIKRPIQEVQEVTSKKIRKQEESEEVEELSNAGLSALEPALTSIIHDMESTLCSAKEPQSSPELLSSQSSDSEDSLNCQTEIFTDNEITVVTFNANKNKDQHDGVRIWKLRYKLEMEEKQFQKEHRYFSSTSSDEGQTAEVQEDTEEPVLSDLTEGDVAQETSNAIKNVPSLYQNNQKLVLQYATDEHELLNHESCKQAEEINREYQGSSDASASDEGECIGKHPIHWVEQLRTDSGHSSLDNSWQCNSYSSLSTAESTDGEWRPLFEF